MGLKNLDVTMMLAKSPCPNITQHFFIFHETKRNQYVKGNSVVGFTIVSVWIRFIQYWQVLVITRVAGE